MFAKRLFSSIVLWAVLLTVLFYADRLGTLPSALLCCLISTLALWECLDMLEKAGLRCSKKIGLPGGILLSAGTWWFCANQPEFTSTFETLFLVTLLIGLFFRQLAKKDNPDPVQTIGNTLFAVIYVSLLFNFIPKIRYLFDGHGWLFVFYLVVVTKFCDIGAYVTGRVFGRHKLIPRISPNKTWEGLVGGFVIAVVASVSAFYYIVERTSKYSDFNYNDALFLGILLGIMGTTGDLAESLIKRETHAKDSGGVLPGIGGALDLIDSLLFTAPVLYAYMILFVRSP
jgi:phosphatidate cytidylyltransferase